MNFVRFASVAVLALFLSGCQKDQAVFNLESVPKTYRSCALEVMPELESRAVTLKELVDAYAKLKKYAGRQNRCLKGLIRWADAQHSAYYQYF